MSKASIQNARKDNAGLKTTSTVAQTGLQVYIIVNNDIVTQVYARDEDPIAKKNTHELY
jgi:hypothetical protein